MVAIAREYAAEGIGFPPGESTSVMNSRPALTGRFLNRDPIREAGGLNLYARTRNPHINRWDVRGLSPHDSFTAGDNSLWDQVVGTASRLLSHAGLRHQRFHASNSWYELWLQTSVPIPIGSGTLRPNFRNPIVRYSQQEPGGSFDGLRGQGEDLRPFDVSRQPTGFSDFLDLLLLDLPRAVVYGIGSIPSEMAEQGRDIRESGSINVYIGITFEIGGGVSGPIARTPRDLIEIVSFEIQKSGILGTEEQIIAQMENMVFTLGGVTGSVVNGTSLSR